MASSKEVFQASTVRVAFTVFVQSQPWPASGQVSFTVLFISIFLALLFPQPSRSFVFPQIVAILAKVTPQLHIGSVDSGLPAGPDFQ